MDAALSSFGPGEGGGRTSRQEDIMDHFQKITIVLAAALVFGVPGWAVAQDGADTGQQNMARQRQGNAGEAGQQGAGDGSRQQDPRNTAGNTNTRRLGPGDGTGTRVTPADGSGYGSPGRFGSGSDQGAKGKGSSGQARKKGGAASSGSTTGSRQNRARSITGSGPGGSLCDGSRRHSASGGARSGARRGGGGNRR
jgi:hypothetical protein